MTVRPDVSLDKSPTAPHFGGTRKLLVFLPTLLVVITVMGVVFWGRSWRTQVNLPPGVTSTEYRQFAQKLRRVSSRDVKDDEVLFRFGVEQSDQQKWQAAAWLFASVDPYRTRFGRDARYLQAQSVLQQDRLRDSEQLFREYLADAPMAGGTPWPFPPNGEERIMAVHYLSYLLAVELRFEERRALLMELVRLGDADLFDTLACHFQSLMEWNNTHGMERLENACRVSPDDLRLRAVLAQYRVAQGRLDEAWEELRECHEKLPLELEITAACLTCLRERNDKSAYSKLASELPRNVDREPLELLRHRGEFALYRHQPIEAKSCFERVIERDPANVACRLGLAKAMSALGEQHRHGAELAAAQRLVRIQNRLGWATSNSPTADVLLEIAQLSHDAGLQAAAIDVCRISMKLFENSKPFEELLEEISKAQSKGESP